MVMEPIHRRRLQRDFGWRLRRSRIVCLGINDEYPFMDEELVALLEARVGPHLEARK